VSWGSISAIMRKDLATVLRNRGVRIPLLVTPLVILVLLPVVLVGGGEILATNTAVPLDAAGGPFGSTDADAQESRVSVPDLDPRGRWAVFVLEVFLAPLFLLVPLIVATVIAADSFAGERERGTLEALLHTPTSDRELLAAKFLAAWVPAITVALTGFAVYSVLANVLAWNAVGRIFFPPPVWLVLAFWVTPAIAAFGLAIMVIASSRVQSLQGAHQVGSLLVLPIVVLLIVQITGVLVLDLGRVLVMGGVLWVASAALLATGTRLLQRERLALRL
jgi:ABC-2 type transport system permease protein